MGISRLNKVALKVNERSLSSFCNIDLFYHSTLMNFGLEFWAKGFDLRFRFRVVW